MTIGSRERRTFTCKEKAAGQLRPHNTSVLYGVLLPIRNSQVECLLTDCKGEGISVFAASDAVPGLTFRTSLSPFSCVPLGLWNSQGGTHRFGRSVLHGEW